MSEPLTDDAVVTLTQAAVALGCSRTAAESLTKGAHRVSPVGVARKPAKGRPPQLFRLGDMRAAFADAQLRRRSFLYGRRVG